MLTTTDVTGFLGRTRSRHGWHWSDWVSYLYLALAVLIVVLPIFWMFMSSIKSPRALVENDPRLLLRTADDAFRRREPQHGVFVWTKPDGTQVDVAFVGPRGINARVFVLGAPNDVIGFPARNCSGRMSSARAGRTTRSPRSARHKAALSTSCAISGTPPLSRSSRRC